MENKSIININRLILLYIFKSLNKIKKKKKKKKKKIKKKKKKKKKKTRI